MRNPRKQVSECMSLAEYRKEVLSARRRVKCVSQAAIARKLDYDQAYVSAVELGKVKFVRHDPKVLEWAEAYDLPVSQFLRLVRNMSDKNLSWSPGPLWDLVIEATPAAAAPVVELGAHQERERTEVEA